MTPAAEKAALEWLDSKTKYEGTGFIDSIIHAKTLKAMLAQPRMPEEPTDGMIDAWWHVWRRQGPVSSAEGFRAGWAALYAHFHAAGDDNQHGQTGFTQAEREARSTPIENPELRTALSTLRGWSAEAAGRSGLQDSVAMVCDALQARLDDECSAAGAGPFALLPCPFCGDHEGVYLEPRGDDHPYSAYARCSACNAVQCHNNETEAAAAWNRRGRP